MTYDKDFTQNIPNLMDFQHGLQLTSRLSQYSSGTLLVKSSGYLIPATQYNLITKYLWIVNIYKVPKVFTPTTKLSFQKAKTRTLNIAHHNCHSSLRSPLFSHKNTQLKRFLSTNFNYRKIVTSVTLILGPLNK